MIRKANHRDLKDIMSLVRLNADAFGEREIPVAEKSIRGMINNGSKEHMFFVEAVSGRAVGCCGFSRQDDTRGVYTLCWLAVHPGFKRKGVATRMYGFVEANIKRLGGRLIILNAGSGEDNRHFYRKMGFRVAGRIPGYYNGSKDMLWYYKPL